MCDRCVFLRGLCLRAFGFHRSLVTASSRAMQPEAHVNLMNLCVNNSLLSSVEPFRVQLSLAGLCQYWDSRGGFSYGASSSYIPTEMGGTLQVDSKSLKQGLESLQIASMALLVITYSTKSRAPEHSRCTKIIGSKFRDFM